MRRNGTLTKKLFHPSWFDILPQSSSTIIPAKFNTTFIDQIESYQTKGFTVIRRSNDQSVQSLTQVNVDVLSQLSNIQNSYLYQFQRYFNYNNVRQPSLRHSFPLANSPMLYQVLSEAIYNIRPLLDSQLSPNSPLIDLSSIVSMPGSERQKTHTDIPYSNNNKIIAGFIALSPVLLESGPTCLYAGSHTQQFARRHVDNTIFDVSHYNSDGSDAIDSNTIPPKINTNSSADDVAVDVTAASPAVAAILDVGDIVIYNTQLFHYGGANTTTIPRALLMFAFQQRTPWGSVDKVSGFTYNCHGSVEGRYRLESFSGRHKYDLEAV